MTDGRRALGRFGPAARALLFVAALLALAAVVAPPLHRALVASGIGRPDRFDRTVRYIVFVPLALAFLATMQPWRDGGPRSYGAPRPGALLGGWAAAFGVLALVLALQLALGWLVFEDPIDGGEVAYRFVKFLLSGLLIATLEEWFFRGWMDRRLRRSVSPRTAALLVALVYALLHVFTARSGADAAPATTAGVLEVYGLWLGRLADPVYAVPRLVGLALFSLVLAAAYRRSRTLFAPMGVHAAAVCVLYSYGALTERVHEPTVWTGGKNVYDGMLGWLVLGLAFLALGGLRRAAPPSEPDV